MSRTFFYTIVAILVLAGISTAFVRQLQTNLPLTPGEQKDVWLVEARIDYIAQGPSSVSLALPDQNPRFHLFSEYAASPGFGFSIVARNNQRRGIWSKREASGKQTLYYKVQLVAEKNAAAIMEPPAAVSPRAIFWSAPEATAAKQLIATATATSNDAASLTRELVKLINSPSLDQNAALLLEHQPQVALLLESLLNQAGVPAHIVLGLYLEDARRRQTLTTMVEVYNAPEWVVVNPETGQQGTPDNLLLWHRGEDGLLDIIGGHQSTVSFSMIQQTVPALQLAQSESSDNLFDLISIHRLPIEEQSMFKLLFLLPLGAIVVVFMRLIVGLKTSGTFMPILLALAFLHTSLLLGLISFTLIVTLGLLLRGYLSFLNLLMVARIAALIVIVVFIISLMSFVSYKLGIDTGITTTFFPMIIIAWTIERMSILWEEEGASEVLKQGIGSLLVAVIAYVLMTNPTLSHLSFNFPELNLVLLAAILLMGQYTGYRLSELRRFRDFLKVIRRAD